MEKFVESLYKNLSMNGFPDKKVSLPTEKMYEVADSKGLSLNTALDELSKKHSLEYEIGDEKIIFTEIIEASESAMDADSLKQAQEFMSKMDPAELKSMQDMIMQMSDGEKGDLMEKAKNMGLFKS